MSTLKTLVVSALVIVLAVGAMAAFGTGQTAAADRVDNGGGTVAVAADLSGEHQAVNYACVDLALTAPFVRDYESDQLAVARKSISPQPAVWCEEICEIECRVLWTGLTWRIVCFSVNCRLYCPPPW